MNGSDWSGHQADLLGEKKSIKYHIAGPRKESESKGFSWNTYSRLKACSNLITIYFTCTVNRAKKVIPEIKVGVGSVC